MSESLKGTNCWGVIYDMDMFSGVKWTEIKPSMAAGLIHEKSNPLEIISLMQTRPANIIRLPLKATGLCVLRVAAFGNCHRPYSNHNII